MDNSFYYIGVLYVIFLIFCLITTFSKRKKKKELIKKYMKGIEKSLPQDKAHLDAQILKESSKQVKEFPASKKIGLVLSGLFLLWIIMGWISAEEWKIFSLLFYTSAICFLVPIIGSVISTMSSKQVVGTAIVEEGNNIAESPIIIIICVTEILIKLLATGYILHQHFTII